MKSSNQVKAISFFLVSLFIVLTFCVLSVNAAQVTWTIETVDAANYVGEYCSMKIDSNNHIHIAYYDDHWKDLKYALSTDGGWTWSIGPVDTGDGQSVGKFCSLALDSNNRPHISYFDETNYYLKYAKWTGSIWSLTTVDNLSGGYTSIVLDTVNNPHISYYDYDLARLKYAYWNGTTWLTKTVDSPSTGPGSVGEGSAIALDSSNRPQIVFRSTYPDQLKFAKWTGTSWNIQVVDNVAVLDPSIIIDDYDIPHISYYDASSGNLMYTAWTISFWYKETVDASANVGRWSSIALDSIGVAHISYYDVYWGDLKYAKMEPGIGWLIRTIDTVDDVGMLGTSIALDSSDHVHISYNDATNHNLKYARDPDETFSVTGYEGFDSNGDQHDDSLLIFSDVNTSYGGSLNVSITALLYDPSSQNIVDDASLIVTIIGNQVETNNVTLTVPPNSPEGLYTFKLLLGDEIGNLEDTITFNNAAYLYPLDATSQIGYLQGTVTDVDTGLPLQGIEICMGEDLTTGNYQTLTNSTGQYYLPLSEGEYEITAHEGEGSLYFDESANVTIIQDVTTTQNFQLQRNNWVLDVSVVGSGTTDPQNTITRQVGSWAQVEAFPDEGWILGYWLLDSMNVGSENPFTVLMDSDHNLTAVFIEKPQVGFLAGQVKDLDTELPIPEAEVAVNGTIELTDPAGNYEFELEPGEYNITVSRLGYISETRFVTIAADAISTQDFLLQKTEFTLLIEVEGMGSTTPSAGTHQYSFGTEIVVEAFPNSGWNLGNWVFDSIWYGQEDAFPLIMDNNHELMVVFIEDTAMEPFIESCGEEGGRKDVFNQGDNMYVTGGFFASGTFEVYIVNDVETWTDGMAIPSRVSGTETTISANLEGHIPPTNVWGNLETVGKYDIVIDVNDNGLYNIGVDALDDGDIEVTAGVEIIPEINSLTIIILVMTATLLVIIFKKEDKKIDLKVTNAAFF